MEEAFCPTVDHSSPLMVFNKQVSVTRVKNLCVKLAEVNHTLNKISFQELGYDMNIAVCVCVGGGGGGVNKKMLV